MTIDKDFLHYKIKIINYKKDNYNFLNLTDNYYISFQKKILDKD
jgi:hypothetical protein